MIASFIVGIGCTHLGRHPELSVKDLVRTAVDSALADGGCAQSDIEEAWFANTRQGLMEGQNVIRGQCALRAMGFEGIPITNVENACASGSSALRAARAHIAAGLCDIALVVGADKMFYPEARDAMFRAFIGGADVHLIDETHERLSRLRADVAPPGVQTAVSQHSFFMDMYAAMARVHMALYGTTQAQIATIAAKNHGNSQFNPLAQYQHAVTSAEVLADPLVSWPLTRAMCAPISDGAAALVVCSERLLHQFNAARATRIAALSLVSGTNRDVEDFSEHIGVHAARQAYRVRQHRTIRYFRGGGARCLLVRRVVADRKYGFLRAR